ncbi:MAG: hypothetical protein FWD49_08100, partial [Firmicutes bacterium]|nr:hypothetical protein [Bacillota bacterium]
MVNKKIAKYLVIIFSIASGIVGLIQLLLGFLGGVQGFLIAGIVLVCFAVALPLFVFVALNPIIKLCVKIGQLNGGRILFFGGMLLVIFSVRFIIKTIIEWASENSGYGSFLWDTFEGWGAGGMTWLAFGGMLLSGVILAFSIMLLRKVKNQESGLSPFDKV